MTGEQINPLLVHLLTKKPFDEISNSPTISSLPGEYGRLIHRKKERIPRELVKNEFIIKCKSCHHEGKYNVGLMFLQPDRVEGHKSEEIVQTTGYFRCKHCNDAGNWEMPTLFRVFINFQLENILSSGEEGDGSQYLKIGESLLFDKTWHLYCSDAEEHLLKKLKKDPNNSLIWDRLGNLYWKGDRPDLAAAVYEYALAIDPKQIESHLTLGNFLFQINEYEKSAYHYKQLLIWANDYKYMGAEELREYITGSLMNLLIIAMELNKEIKFLPTKEELKQAGKLTQIEKAQSQLILDLNFEDPSSFYPLAEVYMGRHWRKLPYRKRTLKIKQRKRKKKKRWKAKKRR